MLYRNNVSMKHLKLVQTVPLKLCWNTVFTIGLWEHSSYKALLEQGFYQAL